MDDTVAAAVSVSGWAAVMLALLVMLSCFCPFHIHMAMRNETTIEGPSPAFDVGTRKNLRSVFGSNPYLWLLPVYGGGPEGDGIHWPSYHVRSQPSLHGGPPHAIEEGRLLSGEDRCSDSSMDE